MTGLEEIRILKVSLDQPFEEPSERTDFLFHKRASDAAAVWCLADLRMPSGRGLHPAHGEHCSWVELCDLDRYLQRRRFSINQPVSAPDSLALDLRMRELHGEFVGAAHDRESCLQLLFALLLVEFQRLSDSAPKTVSLSEERLEQVIRRMLTEYQYPWRVEELSELLNVSPSYLNRLCRRKYGMSPIDMLIEHRITLAKRYLRLPGAKVGTVCEAVGFSDIYYFSRAFKKRCGITPTEFMKNGTSP